MLTKTDYLAYLDCPMHLWALKHGQLDKQSKDAFLELLIEQGYEVEKLAKEFISKYIAGIGGLDISDSSKLQFEYECVSKCGNFQARIDAIVFDPVSGKHDIFEIKSSSDIHGKGGKYKQDATFQYLVARDNLEIGRVFLVHPNKEYVRRGELNLLDLFLAEDVTDDVLALESEVLASRQQALDILSITNTALIPTCLKPKTCPCLSLYHPNKPEYSIFEIERISEKKKLELLDNDILAIDDIPPDTAKEMFSEKVNKQIQAVQNRTTFIDKPAIQKQLSKLEYPLYFIDYETSNKAIPLFDGYSPFKHIPVQWSLHILDENHELTHHEFLHTTKSDPTPDFAQKIMQVIGQKGSIIVWHKPFEMMINREAGERNKKYRKFYENLNNRVFDIKEIFSKGYYIDYRFKGSSSIKKVLPVLVPKMSYEDMQVGNGTDAIEAWDKLVLDETTSQTQKQQIQKDLLAYCKQDTLAMVEVFEVVRGRVKS